MKFCMHILILTRCTPWDCLMTFEIGWVLPRFNFWKKWDYCKMTFIIVEALPRAKFWKSENGLISWTEWNILIDFCVNIDIIKTYPKRLWNVIFHRSRFCQAPNSEKVKMVLSLELSGILWWNFAYTLVYWQDVDHEIVKWHLGLVEVQILKKKWKLTLKLFGIFWWIFADNLMLKRSSPRNC